MNCRNPTKEVLMWILLYADDISLACDTAEKLKEAAITMDATVLCWGLTLNTKKTKALCIDKMQLKLQIQNVLYPFWPQAES